MTNAEFRNNLVSIDSEVHKSTLEYYGYRNGREKIYERLSRFAKIAAFASALAPLPAIFVHGQLDLEQTEVPFQTYTVDGNIELENGLSVTLQNFKGFEDVKIYSQARTAPTKLIVLFGQTHMVTSEQIGTADIGKRWNNLSKTVESQKAIYSALKTLRKENVLNQVCVEGYATEESINYEIDFNKNFLRYSTTTNIATYLPDSEVAEAIKLRTSIIESKSVSGKLDTLLKINNLFDAYVSDYKYTIGGAELLATEKIIGLCPAEYKETSEAASLTMDSVRGKPYSLRSNAEKAHVIKTVLEDREDAALKRIATESDKVIGLTYGNAHDFTDALRRWNDENPDNTFALAVYSGNDYKSFPDQEKWFSAGLSEKDVDLLSYATQYKSWEAEEPTYEQYLNGISWLLEHGENNGFSNEKTIAVAKKVGVL